MFVEKPLALTRAEVDGILDVVERTGNDRLMVGFNRRFAPLLVGLRERFGATGTPVSARYLVNAGRLAAGSWYLDEQLEGSRFLGEGGHFIDTLSWWVGHHPVEVTAVGTPGGSEPARHAALRRRLAGDGHLLHRRGPARAQGDARRRPEAAGTPGSTTSPGPPCGPEVAATPSARSTGQDKGQRAELAGFVDAVRLGAAMPIGLDSLVATTRATIAVGESLVSGGPVTP